MKWFQHDTSAMNDARIQLLGDALGLEGIGGYWALLEEIARQSDTFHLRVPGVNAEADRKFEEIRENPGKLPEDSPLRCVDIAKIPERPVRLLARTLFTTSPRLAALIDTSVRAGLFDPVRWEVFGLLYSVSLERRADNYAKRRRRAAQDVRTDSGQCAESVRTLSEHAPDSVQTMSGNVTLQQQTEQQLQKINRTVQIHKQQKHVDGIEKRTELSTLSPQCTEMGRILDGLNDGSAAPVAGEPDCSLDLDSEALDFQIRECRELVRQWNERHDRKFDLNLAPAEYRKLFCGGDRNRKLALCYQAFKMQGERLDYPGLVRRALVLMLRESERRRIVNPFGWLWSCLHGTGEGTIPWVVSLTPDEERLGRTAC